MALRHRSGRRCCPPIRSAISLCSARPTIRNSARKQTHTQNWFTRSGPSRLAAPRQGAYATSQRSGSSRGSALAFPRSESRFAILLVSEPIVVMSTVEDNHLRCRIDCLSGNRDPIGNDPPPSHPLCLASDQTTCAEILRARPLDWSQGPSGGIVILTGVAAVRELRRSDCLTSVEFVPL